MQIDQIPLPFLSANCYLIQPEPCAPVLVIDPGHDGLRDVRERLAGRAIGAVLLTHGHPDHVWDASELAGTVPTYIPQPDSYRLNYPLVGEHPMNIELKQMLNTPWRRPDNIVELGDTAVSAGFEPVTGLTMRMIPAPGHTEGSALFFFDNNGIHALSGDVIFAGSVGRTDLPGGDDKQMLHTLRTLANTIDPETVLLPGHGPQTTMAAELKTNPYLRRAQAIG